MNSQEMGVKVSEVSRVNFDDGQKALSTFEEMLSDDISSAINR